MPRARALEARGRRRRAGRALAVTAAPAPRLPVGPRADGRLDRAAHRRGGLRGRRGGARRAARRRARRRARRPAVPDLLPGAARATRPAPATWPTSPTAIRAKLVRRHPHVFGDAVAADARRGARPLGADQARAGGPRGHLPRRARARCRRCCYARKVQRRAAAVGFDWARADDAWPTLAEEVAELRAALAAHGAAASVEPAPDVRARGRRRAVRGRQRAAAGGRRSGARAARRRRAASAAASRRRRRSRTADGERLPRSGWTRRTATIGPPRRESPPIVRQRRR